MRDNRLYLKTLEGLKRVHVLFRRLDDEYCDPSVLRTDSALGVPGLLGAVRAGNVAIANALGSGVLETPALPGFLPMICQKLFGEPLELPSIATWWCGEAPALEYAIKHLPELVIKPAFPSMKLEPTFGHALDSAGRESMVEECARRRMPLWRRSGCAFPRHPPGRASASDLSRASWDCGST